MAKRIFSLICLLALTLGLTSLPAAAADRPADWAANEVAAAVDLGLVPEELQNRYAEEITRAEFCRLAVICLRDAALVNGWDLTATQDVSFADTSDPDVLTAAGLGIVSGVGNGQFLPDKGITRQEAAVMLHKTLKAMGAPITSSGAVFSDQAEIASWAVESVSAVLTSQYATAAPDQLPWVDLLR